MSEDKSKLSDLWDRAIETGDPIPLNDFVVCDSCNVDWTARPESGGFIFGSYAYCPECAPRMLASIQRYGEERYIKASCPLDKSFADFCRDYRGPDATIQIRNLGT